jgi:hypothetical protein
MGRDHRVTPRLLAPLSCAVVTFALVSAGCRSGDTGASPGAAAGSARRSPRPVDRLTPGELAEGKVDAFGLTLPREMTLERRFPDAVHAVGPIPAESVANYVRQRVEVAHVELGAARTVFPKARIKGSKPDRQYRIEVVAGGAQTRLLVKDITPPPSTHGLSEAERWRRAGLSPDGKPLDPKRLQ